MKSRHLAILLLVAGTWTDARSASPAQRGRILGDGSFRSAHSLLAVHFGAEDWLLTEGMDNELRQWSVPSGELMTEVPVPCEEGVYRAAVLSPDHTRLAIHCPGENRVVVLSTRTWKPGCELDLNLIGDSPPDELVWSADSKRLAVRRPLLQIEQPRLAIFDVASGKIVYRTESFGSGSFGGGDSFLGCDSGWISVSTSSIQLRAKTSLKKIWSRKVDLSGFRHPEISPDGKFLVVHDDHEIRWYGTARGKPIRTRRFDERVWDVHFVTNKELWALTTSGVSVISTRTRKTVRRIAAEPVGIRFSVSPEGTWAALHRPARLDILDTKTGTRQNAEPGLDGGASELAFSPDGQLLIAADDSTRVVLFDLDGQVAREVRLPDLSGPVALSAGDRFIAVLRMANESAGSAGGVSVLDLKTMEPVAEIPGVFGRLAFGKSRLVVVGDERASVFDVGPAGRPKPVKTFAICTDRCQHTRIARLLDGERRLLVGQIDNNYLRSPGHWRFHLFDLQAGARLHTASCLDAFIDDVGQLPDGVVVLGGVVRDFGGRVTFMVPEEERLRRLCRGLPDGPGAMSGDGSLGLATDDDNRKAVLYREGMCRVVKEYPLAFGGVSMVRFSPDAKKLAVGYANGLIHVFDVE
jgi:WD40 repeat protein